MFWKFQIFKKIAKTSKNLKKTTKKKTSNFFVCSHFYTERKNFIIKKACFMLNFLNFQTLPSYLFFVVASSLSILCGRLVVAGLHIQYFSHDFFKSICLCFVGNAIISILITSFPVINSKSENNKNPFYYCTGCPY